MLRLDFRRVCRWVGLEDSRMDGKVETRAFVCVTLVGLKEGERPGQGQICGLCPRGRRDH